MAATPETSEFTSAKLRIDASGWLLLVTEFESHFFRVAGSHETLSQRSPKGPTLVSGAWESFTHLLGGLVRLYMTILRSEPDLVMRGAAAVTRHVLRTRGKMWRCDSTMGRRYSERLWRRFFHAFQNCMVHEDTAPVPP